jgi:parvulin-like peptidyl-prolyl isomerase
MLVSIAAAIRCTFLRGTTLIVLLAAAFGACGLITDEERVKIAQVGDRAITRGDLNLHITNLPIEQKRQYMQERAKVNSKDVKLRLLDQMVVHELLMMEADKRGIEVTDEEIDNEMKRRGIGTLSPEALNEYGSDGEAYQEQERGIREGIREELRLAKLQGQVLSPTLRASNEEIRQFYEANKNRYIPLERVRIRFVTCTTAEEAQKTLDRVQAGESFADIVSKIQKETEGKAAQEWPETVYMPLAGIRPLQLRDALLQAEPGGLIGPIEREDGFDIVQLIGRQPPAPEALRNAVMRDLIASTFSQFIAQLKDDYKVKVFPDNVPEDKPY